MKEVKLNNCPFCKMEIEHLKVIEQNVKRYFDVYLDADNIFLDWTENDYTIDGDLIFNCPECNKTITTNQEDAINFLKNSKENKK